MDLQPEHEEQWIIEPDRRGLLLWDPLERRIMDLLPIRSKVAKDSSRPRRAACADGRAGVPFTVPPSQKWFLQASSGSCGPGGSGESCWGSANLLSSGYF